MCVVSSRVYGTGVYVHLFVHFLLDFSFSESVCGLFLCFFVCVIDFITAEEIFRLKNGGHILQPLINNDMCF